MARFLFNIVIIAALTSCSDIFSTRTPEDPDGTADNYFNESVLELKTNFKTSLLGLDTYLYESLFLNSINSEFVYKFVSEASDIPQPDIFDEWDVEDEKKFLNGLKSESFSFSEISLTNEPIDETADSLNLSVDYLMTVTDSSGTREIKGNFIFDLIKLDGHFWYIRTWTDISSVGNISFSKLKEPYAL